MTIKFPENVVILSCLFKVLQDPETAGGAFSISKMELKIGTKFLETDPNYTFNVICHEVLEIIYCLMNVRYDDPSVEQNWKFFMDHKEFQLATNIFSSTIQNFVV